MVNRQQRRMTKKQVPPTPLHQPKPVHLPKEAQNAIMQMVQQAEQAGKARDNTIGSMALALGFNGRVNYDHKTGILSAVEEVPPGEGEPEAETLADGTEG